MTTSKKHKWQSYSAARPAIGIFPFSLVLLCVIIPCFAIIHQPHHGPVVEVPHVRSPHDLRAADREDALKVMVQRDGVMLENNYKVVNTTELTKRLRIAVAQGSPRRVYVWADRRAKYGTVKLALDAIRAAGLEDVSIVAEKD